jgi:hypothetical protein
MNRAMGWVLLGAMASAGCTSLDCCRWWGRNTDGSNNLARNKPNPVQQGPIAGSYQNPSAGQYAPQNMQVQPPANVSMPPGQAPVVVSSPAQSAPVPSNNAAPPTYPGTNTPINLNVPGTFPQPPSSPPELIGPTSSNSSSSKPNTMVENTPSIAPPTMPDVAIKGPSIDLSAMNQQSPLLGAPPNASNSSVDKALAQMSAPTIAMPNTTMPQSTMMPTIPTPMISGMQGMKMPALNPNSTPPPLPAPPAVPQFVNR